MFHDALKTLESSESTPPALENRIRLFLSYATAAVMGDTLEQGLSSYNEALSLADILSADTVTVGVNKALRRVNNLVITALACHAFGTIQAQRVSVVAGNGGRPY